MSSQSRRFLNLNLYIRNSGYHESAWKVSPADPTSVLGVGHFIDLARTAERGVLDSIFLPDSPGVAEFRSEFLPGVGFDPVQLLSSVATSTEQVGLIATVSTTYSYPWDTARRLATLDFLSLGRAGWNIVTTVEPAAAGNFGDRPHPPRADRYERADEYVEVVLKLWDGWEDDAMVGSKPSGMWADTAKLHPPRHHGTHFDVSGYLPFPRSPQGHPLLAQAGSSAQGVALAAKYADAVFTPALLDDAPKTSFGASIYKLAAPEPTSFRAVAQKLSALPGGLDFTGTPEAMAELISDWWRAGACDGFTLMPNVLPSELSSFVDHVLPILQSRGIARTEYAGHTLRDHLGLPRPSFP
jgi:alkanesulfonate monooxygenase SsuD/methylene tetrahydromethanopterin reductase-like flavin-dependent oxidoreductase (luciferase family)